MAQNYNLNSTFGFNVTGNNNIKPQQQEAEKSQINSGLFDSTLGYTDKYEKVFSGDIERQINMYSRQAMIVGMNLKAADKTIRKFDVNI